MASARRTDTGIPYSTATGHRRKRARIGQLDTAVLQRILNNLASPENQAPSPTHPLGGQVQIDTIGMVPVPWLREELDRREVKANG